LERKPSGAGWSNKSKSNRTKKNTAFGGRNFILNLTGLGWIVGARQALYGSMDQHGSMDSNFVIDLLCNLISEVFEPLWGIAVKLNEYHPLILDFIRHVWIGGAGYLKGQQQFQVLI
jgi:hypothetical protein